MKQITFMLTFPLNCIKNMVLYVFPPVAYATTSRMNISGGDDATLKLAYTSRCKQVNS